MDGAQRGVRRASRSVLSRLAPALMAVVLGIAAIAGPLLRPVGTLAGELGRAYSVAMSQRVLGSDGRFTILLLGSDARPSIGGMRTDAILVASVDPATGRAAVLSIPRDTVSFPLSATRKYGGKVNALYQYLARTSKTPGTLLRQIIGRALGVEIDAYALIGFTGFRKLVNHIGGVDVYVAKAFYDPVYSIRRGKKGFGLSKGWHHLTDLVALAFARTRHADNDYARSRRQQQLIVAAIEQVESRGVEKLFALLAAGRGLVTTDLPLEHAPLIFATVGRADLAHARRAVFGPRTFATTAGSASIVLRLSACRAWIRDNFPPARPGGTWLPGRP